MRKVLLTMILILGITGYALAQPSMYQEPGSDIISGQTKIVTTNIAVPLASTGTRVLSVVIQTLPTNVENRIFIGSSSVTPTTGIVLASGSSITLNVNDLNKIYINSLIVNDGVSYIGITR